MNWIDSTLISLEPTTEGTDPTTSNLEVEVPEARPKASRLITKALTPALQFWLRSQLDRIEQLTVHLEGSDRQILQGRLPKVEIVACGAVYQGLHLSHIHLVAQNIRINIGQILRGQPLRLLDPIFVTVKLRLHETDFNASLTAPILAKTLTELFLPRLAGCDRTQAQVPVDLKFDQVAIAGSALRLSGSWIAAHGQAEPIWMQMGLKLVNGHTLQLVAPQLWRAKAFANCEGSTIPVELDLEHWQTLADVPVDLGTDVEIQALDLDIHQLSCQGAIAVRSET